MANFKQSLNMLQPTKIRYSLWLTGSVTIFKCITTMLTQFYSPIYIYMFIYIHLIKQYTPHNNDMVIWAEVFILNVSVCLSAHLHGLLLGDPIRTRWHREIWFFTGEATAKHLILNFNFSIVSVAFTSAAAQHHVTSKRWIKFNIYFHNMVA